RPPSPAEPPTDLGASGADLWRAILADWIIDDAASLAVLAQAAHAADRAESLRRRIEQIEAGGAVARTQRLTPPPLAAPSLGRGCSGGSACSTAASRNVAPVGRPRSEARGDDVGATAAAGVRRRHRRVVQAARRHAGAQQAQRGIQAWRARACATARPHL